MGAVSFVDANASRTELTLGPWLGVFSSSYLGMPLWRKMASSSKFKRSQTASAFDQVSTTFGTPIWLSFTSSSSGGNLLLRQSKSTM